VVPAGSGCDAQIARVAFAPTGEILDAGRAARLFSTAQTRAIIARDRHCIWPGCDAPPFWCECHDRKHCADGRETSIDEAVHP
jgi:hypothetical protein